MPPVEPPPAAASPRRLLLWAAGGSLLLGPLAACGPAQPMRVGFVGGLSGRVADLGIGGRNGTQLAVDDLNAAGGVDGRRLELLVRDDEQDEAVARRALTELADAAAAFVVGPMTSAIAVALAPLADQRGVPLISPTATTQQLSGKADAFFRIVPDVRTGAGQQAELLLRRGLRRLVTVTDTRNLAFAQGWSDTAGARFTAGGGQRVTSVEFEAAPGLKFTEVAQRVAAARGDVVLIAASAADSAVLAQQVRRLQPGLVIALSSWAGTEQLPQLGGRALDGVLVPQYFDRAGKSARFAGFVSRYRDRFGEAPGYPSVNAYDAVLLGVAGVRDAGRGPVMAALRRPRAIDGLQRRVEIDEHGDSPSPIYHCEIRDGRYVPLPS